MTKRYIRSEQEVEITHIKGSGPGGQNRNKRMSGIRVRHKATGLVAVATERRSQEQNRQAALERLEAKLARLFRRPTPRVKTKKTQGSQIKRVEKKTLRGQVKKLRQKPSDSDW